MTPEERAELRREIVFAGDNDFFTGATVTKLLDSLEAAEAENQQFRAALSAIATHVGASAAETCTAEFLASVAAEVRLVVEKLQREWREQVEARATTQAALAEAKSNADSETRRANFLGKRYQAVVDEAAKFAGEVETLRARCERLTAALESAPTPHNHYDTIGDALDDAEDCYADWYRTRRAKALAEPEADAKADTVNRVCKYCLSTKNHDGACAKCGEPSK